MAVRLRTDDSPDHVWLDLRGGLRLRCRPYDAEAAFAAGEVARGHLPANLSAIKPATQEFGRYWFHRIVELAVAMCDEWEGVVDEEGNEVPFSAEYLRLAMRQEPGLAESFDAEYRLRVLEKKDSTNGLDGAGEEGKSIAPSAESSTSPVRGEKKGSPASAARS